ncbi:MAG: restriction endonuclease subunit S [Deltaproteobacteria bacterium]|nr:restriction endonuclease subunit S [Deltaproteobacteria bacterium]
MGEINIAPHKCCIGRGIAAVKAKDVDDGFLYQSMLLRRKVLQKMAQGSTSQAINYRELSEMLILLPPPPEQKKIAKILTTLDDAIEKTTQTIEKTKVLKKGLMQRPVNKQKKAGEVLNPVDDDIEKESNYKEQLKSLKKGLIQVLVTGKLRLEV